MSLEFEFEGSNFILTTPEYSNGRICLFLEVQEEMGYFVPYKKLTVNIPEVELEDNEIIVDCDCYDNNDKNGEETLRIIKFLGIATPVKPYKIVRMANSFKTYLVFKLKKQF